MHHRRSLGTARHSRNNHDSDSDADSWPNGHSYAQPLKTQPFVTFTGQPRGPSDASPRLRQEVADQVSVKSSHSR